MRRPLTDADFVQQLANFERSAWRWEQQPAYYIGYEHDQFAKFLAGEPESPTDNPDLRDWMAQIRRQVHEGKTIGRVRVVETPPTDYQRWMRWMDRWNREAGETIQYLTRRAAQDAQIIPHVGPNDWWLFDDRRLMVMYHDEQGKPLRYELLEDEPEVAQAIRWRAWAIAAANREAAAAER